MENKRTEYLGLYVTPEIKKAFEGAKDNKELQETIIKNFLKSETDWLTEEIKEIDEATIKYSARLLGIRDAFSLAQDKLGDEIATVVDTVSNKMKPISELISSAKKASNDIKSDLVWLNEFCSKINFWQLEQAVGTITKFRNLSEQEKEYLTLLLKEKS